MQTKRTDILAYLVELYKDFYTHKDLFNVKFKYSIHEIENFYEQIKDISDTGVGEKPCVEGKISEDVMALKTSDDVKEYFSKYLSNDNQSKDDLLKKLSLSEFSYLYNIIYSSPLKSNMRKIDALNTIEKYFNGISRAISMKP
jgi:flagellin-specific chaperone FliS